MRGSTRTKAWFSSASFNKPKKETAALQPNSSKKYKTQVKITEQAPNSQSVTLCHPYLHVALPPCCKTGSSPAVADALPAARRHLMPRAPHALTSSAPPRCGQAQPDGCCRPSSWRPRASSRFTCAKSPSPPLQNFYFLLVLSKVRTPARLFAAADELLSSWVACRAFGLSDAPEELSLAVFICCFGNRNDYAGHSIIFVLYVKIFLVYKAAKCSVFRAPRATVTLSKCPPLKAQSTSQSLLSASCTAFLKLPPTKTSVWLPAFPLERWFSIAMLLVARTGPVRLCIGETLGSKESGWWFKMEPGLTETWSIPEREILHQEQNNFM